MTAYFVTVTRNGAVLTVDSPPIELKFGDSVQWNFSPPLGPQELAFIQFVSPPGEPLGPFQSLEPSAANVRALGNNGVPGEYLYTAFVLNDQGPAATSTSLSRLVNLSTTVDTSPVATVVCTETHLQVDPQHLQVEGGRTALWYITGVPDGHFVTFHFDVNNGNGMVGPFTSFQVSQGFGNAQVATGADFSPPSGQASVSYNVSLRGPDGFVVAGDDPVIEPPPGWPPGDLAEP